MTYTVWDIHDSHLLILGRLIGWFSSVYSQCRSLLPLPKRDPTHPPQHSLQAPVHTPIRTFWICGLHGYSLPWNGDGQWKQSGLPQGASLSLQSPNWNSSNNMHDSLLFARLQLACMPPLHRTHTVSTSASTSPSEACLLNNSFSLTFRQQIQLTFALQAWASNDNARCLPSDSVLILPLSLPDLGAHRHCEPWKRKF